TRTVVGAAPGNEVTDASRFKLYPVLVVVVCTIGEHGGRFVQRMTDLSAEVRAKSRLVASSRHLQFSAS
ncbi:MAG: hypothetical protein ACSLFF_11350, partial [Solirubrobacterales bacterium]